MIILFFPLSPIVSLQSSFLTSLPSTPAAPPAGKSRHKGRESIHPLATVKTIEREGAGHGQLKRPSLSA